MSDTIIQPTYPDIYDKFGNKLNITTYGETRIVNNSVSWCFDHGALVDRNKNPIIFNDNTTYHLIGGNLYKYDFNTNTYKYITESNETILNSVNNDLSTYYSQQAIKAGKVQPSTNPQVQPETPTQTTTTTTEQPKTNDSGKSTDQPTNKETAPTKNTSETNTSSSSGRSNYFIDGNQHIINNSTGQEINSAPIRIQKNEKTGKTEYIDLETNKPISKEEADKKVTQAVNKENNILTKAGDKVAEVAKTKWEEWVDWVNGNEKDNKDSEMESGAAFGPNSYLPLTDELLANQGLLGYHPINGQFLMTEMNKTYAKYINIPMSGSNYHEGDLIKYYRNKLFGSSFQFLDSVDRRFPNVNTHVGYEYLRNFIMHSAILHIYPGLPYYQGGTDPLEWLKALLTGGGQDILATKSQDAINKVNEAAKKELEEAEKAKKELEEAKTNKSESENNSDPNAKNNKIIDKKLEDYIGTVDDQKRENKEGQKMSGTWSGIQKALFAIFFSTKYQRRLFGIKYTYEVYMRYVNMMCRTMALFLNLTVANQLVYPQGTFVFEKTPEKGAQSKFVTFEQIDWSNYRMLEDASSFVQSTFQTSLDVIGEVFGATGGEFVNGVKKIVVGTITAVDGSLASGAGYLSGTIPNILKNIENLQGASKELDVAHETKEALEGAGEKWFETIVKGGKEVIRGIQGIGQSFLNFLAVYKDVQQTLEQRTQSVEFMVEPFSPQEQFQNTTTQSVIKQAVDKAAGIGTEVAFVTQTGAIQDGWFGKAFEMMGKGTVSVIDAMNGLAKTTPLGGSFLHNLVSGALGAVTGNRYIFPDIYQSSNSSSSYSFKINLVSPYGDIYNYYMNIIVPLCHLYCLVNPRLVTANSSNTPFIVRAFVPGLATCELGIIDTLTIHKNAEGNRVSTNGFPLSVTVEFSIHELYHHSSISPWDDPLSVINNECLLDYLCNLAGVPPTYSRTQLLTASLSNVLAIQTNIGAMIGNYLGDIMLGWFGMNFGSHQ